MTKFAMMIGATTGIIYFNIALESKNVIKIELYDPIRKAPAGETHQEFLDRCISGMMDFITEAVDDFIKN